MTAYRQRQPGAILLCCPALLLLGLAAAQGYVSWRAQYGYIFAAKHVPSVLEALGLDTGAVIFALLGLAHARMGRPARIERTLNVACALGSMCMNLLSADLGSPRSVAVYVLPALLYAASSDRLIATAAHAAGVQETSLRRFLGTALLYGLRAVVALPSTAWACGCASWKPHRCPPAPRLRKSRRPRSPAPRARQPRRWRGRSPAATRSPRTRLRASSV
jgi:hypothetical protein